MRSRRPPGETKAVSAAERRRQRDEQRRERDERRAARHPDPHRHGPPHRGLDRVGPAPFGVPPQLRRGIEAVAEDVRDEWTQLRSRVAPEGTVTIFFSDNPRASPLERTSVTAGAGGAAAALPLVREELLTHRGFDGEVPATVHGRL